MLNPITTLSIYNDFNTLTSKETPSHKTTSLLCSSNFSRSLDMDITSTEFIS